ncbi:MAG: LiaF-related protein [Sphaerochaetaceae bacterium]|nr:LiaF-related protein [Sphaerochaetaceae bacterium]MDD4762391.1 LiaF-related protein [Sphaerochaetaceae bacterium]
MVKIILGIIIVVVGMNFILSAAGIEFTIFFDGWWTLVIILLAIFSIIKNGPKAINLIMLFGGMWLLARERNWIPDWMGSKYIIGAIILAVGLIFLLGNRREPVSDDYEEHRSRAFDRDEERRSTTCDREQDDDQFSRSRPRTSNNSDYTVVFGSQTVRNSSGNLDGSRCFSLFGDLNIDFTDAVFDHDVVIDATALFASIALRFPKDVQVVSRGVPIFGGIDIKRKEPILPGAPVVTVRCLIAFGSVEVQ